MLTDDEKIEIIYNSLAKKEVLHFNDQYERMDFNKYMLYLNFLESQHLIKIKMYNSILSKKSKIVILKSKKKFSSNTNYTKR
ncbi:hypothetical protein FSBG_00122 [Fusobacterium gonidiaformans 3-1-5R]|uniref:Uncharacterized protein n=1 Tax=Fusobacterium gonidiaformans 3-1-5R TaxID=469605 RepID=E5BEU4_9FUSO|nr:MULTISPECIES: hypothetical protein [Fusobacterium]EFS20625.1 hypothetical protein FSBG_00122 [Fusobacterium gonidiaformans 3-1-5R]KYM58516.1 hypothetical protein A2U09_07610 [Fusobacterium necrophorum subsp. funduliforme]